MRSTARACVLLLLAAFATPSLAATWNEVGDAGNSIAGAQSTAGTGPLTTIQGQLAFDTDEDLYCIRVVDPAQFRAWLLCGSFADNDLWLFDVNGFGVAGNDGCQFGQTNVGTPLVTTPGIYYLAITPSDREAFHPGVAPIWNPPATGSQRAPDGPGAPGPLASWGGPGVVSFFNNYTVNLTGAEFCDPATPAEPVSWGRMKVLYR